MPRLNCEECKGIILNTASGEHHGNFRSTQFGTIKPSRIFLNFIKEMETGFNAAFKSCFERKNIIRNIVAAIYHLNIFCDTCRAIHHNWLLNLFVRSRLYFQLRFINAQIKEAKQNKISYDGIKLTKLISD